MKKRLPILIIAAFMAISCGKKDNSSGGGSSATNFVDGISTSGGSAYGTIEEVRNRFQALSFAGGITSGTEIVHAGTRYASNSNSGSYDLWGIIKINYNTSSGNSTRALRVNSASQDTVNVSRGTSSNNYGYTYGTATENITRSSADYQEMLGLDTSKCYNAQVVTVSIYTQVYSGTSQGTQQTLTGNKITCYGSNGYPTMISIVSDALPLAANPILIQTTNSMGYLVKAGNAYITGIQ